ncbi:energy-coupling factor transport system permease protein [Sporomusaceae bacterium BoRhaA]|uniref:energy-coupling factor transporter transmembrane component T family protein n=1 Tax=Pelorhabdus rhamnosifermentans TaxID=2772457 RepID=UPI001C063C95|nr:energy-coupling factor transporter transmembrane component T [Pelorhabdus rhamnosifermentans]MBU2700546.1 energy-coupling factor transport system permease protein [Pelorhabdus rhamnosifermentans]
MEIRTITKFILACTVTLWSVVLQNPLLLILLVVAEVAQLAIYSKLKSSQKMVFSLFGFSIVLAIIQLVFGAAKEVAILSALKMLSMTLIFVYLMSTTKLTQFHHLFVHTFHLPAEYAFMLTSVFRFVPDLIRESREVREAQTCRGYRTGRGVKQVISYAALIGPLVLRAVSRSESMAMALALRGFSPCSVEAEGPIGSKDYAFFAGLVAVTFFLLRASLASL